MTILTSPTAPELVRAPSGPATLGALLTAIRRLIARGKTRARRRAAASRLAAADEALLRDIGLRREDIWRVIGEDRR